MGGIALRKKRRIKFTQRQILIFTVCLCLLLGTFVGSLVVNKFNLSIGDGNFSLLFGNTLPQNIINEHSIFRVFIKYGKYIFGIWLCGFLSSGCAFIFAILALKGMEYGVTTAMIIKGYGFKGVFFAMIGYLPQGLLIVPAILGIAYAAMKMSVLKYNNSGKNSILKRDKEKLITEYTIILLSALITIFISAAVEVKLIPIFLKNIHF